VCQHQVSQQIGVDRVLRMRSTGVRARYRRLQAHEPHQSLNPLAVDRVAPAPQNSGHLAAAVEGRLQVLAVDDPHQGEVVGVLPGGPVVVGRAGQAEQLALALDGQLGMARLDEPSAYPLICRDFF